MNNENQKRVLLSAFVMIITIFFTTVSFLFAYPGGAPAGRTGGMSSSTCTSCHSSLTANNGSLSVSGAPSSYTPGQQYSITVRMAPPSPGSGYGFQISSRSTPGGTQAGTLAGQSAGTGMNGTSGGVTYVGHTSAGCAGAASCSWTVSWTAPAATAGAVQFDVAAVSGFSGDYFAQKSVTATPQASQPAPQFAASNAVSPASGSTAGGTSVTITGSNFVSGAVVSFGSTAASTTFVSASQLTAISPSAASAGMVALKVQNPDGQSSTLPNGFTYTQVVALAPQFAASNPVSPNSGDIAGGTVVTINGSNFVSGAAVSFGSASASTTFMSASQLTAILPPAAAAGAVMLKVQNPDGQSATLPGGFTYNLATSTSAPQFAASNASFPHVGSIHGGTPITINGSNFVNGAKLIFGSNQANTTFVSASQLTAVSPSASGAGTVDLKIQNPDGQSATLPGAFVYFDDTQLKTAYAVATVIASKQAGQIGSGVDMTPADPTSKSAGLAATGEAPAGSGIFSFSQNNVLVTTVGTASASPTSSLLMFADSKPFACSLSNCALQNNTGLAVINQSGSTAHLTYTLLNPDGTPAMAPVFKDLIAGAHDQGFITDFFGSGVANFTGTLKVDSDVPVSALTLQLTNNQAPRNEALFTSFPVADLTQPAPSGNLVFAQLVDGGGYQTRIILLNTTGSAITGNILFFKDNGSPASFNMNGSGPVAQLAYSISPQGEFSALSVGTGPLTTGFALVVPDAGKATPVGTGLFTQTQNGFTFTTAGVPASPAIQEGLILADTNPNVSGLAQDTGVALANPSATQTADVSFKLHRLSDGLVVASKNLSEVPGHSALPPHGHDALFVDQIFTNNEARNFTGTLSIETVSSDGVSALTLLETNNQRGDALLTTLPVATESSSTAPVFFPQLVAFGGYQTQLILLNASGSSASSGTLRFFSDTGSPLALPLNDQVSGSFIFNIPSKGGTTFK
jgi:hypothetical protein